MAVKRDPTDAVAMRELDAIALAERRRRFHETTMAERIEAALELSDLAAELRAGSRDRDEIDLEELRRIHAPDP